VKNFFKQYAFGGFTSSGSCDCEATERSSVLFVPQNLTPEQKAQARENIGVTERKEIEVVLKEIGADLVDESAHTVFDAVDNGNTVVLYRNTENGTRIYYKMTAREQEAMGGECITFTYRSAVIIEDIHVHRGGMLNNTIGYGTENLVVEHIEKDVGAPATSGAVYEFVQDQISAYDTEAMVLLGEDGDGE
jgi:hypothetical protein